MLLAALYLALVVATAVIARRHPEFALAGDSAAALAAELAAGALVIAAALAVRRRSARFPGLLLVAALAWPLAEWNTPAAGAAFTVGLILYAAWPPLLAAAALRGPDERPLGKPVAVLLALALTTSMGGLGAASAAVFDPATQGCVDCPANRLLVAGDASTWQRLGQTGLAVSAAWVAAFVLVALVRLARSSPARVRVAAPVLIPATAAVVLFGVDALHGLDRGFLSNDDTDRALRVGQAAALALVAGGVVWGRVAARRTRAALARLVIDLGASPAPGGLRGRLASALGDPSLELVHALDPGPGWIDADGCAVTPSAGPGREATPIVAGALEVAAVVHREGLLDDPALAAELAVAARLGLEHERLRASQRRHLDELRASRARIVATTDAERRRLERDLHDGAQQRLVTLAIGVRLARRLHAPDDPVLDGELAAAEEELRVAIGELRELAHGLFPAALDEDGLRGAIELLAEEQPRLVPGALPAQRCAAPVESAAYYLVGEALRLANGGDVEVDATLQAGRLVVQLRAASGFAAVPVRVEDRVGAVRGTITTAGDTIRAELPCDW